MSCDLSTVNQGIQGLHPYQAGKPIEELQRELGLERVVKLASDENPLASSPYVLAALEKATVDIARYPDSNGFELKQALSDFLSVGPDQLTLGNGSNDVLDLLARTFLEPGKSAVYSEHAFIVYPIAVKACGARAIVVPAKNWGHDLDAMAEAIEEDTTMVFIANPNNPTGTSVTEAELVAFLDKVPPHVVVVLDEAYIEYVVQESLPNGVTLLARYGNLVVTRTFSKAWGLAGLRVGYGVASPSLTEVLNRVRAPFNVNGLALAAATAVLGDTAYLKAARQVNEDGMAQLISGLTALGLPFIPSAGNFLAVEFPCDAMSTYQKLLHEGVIVRPVGVYGMPQHLRITIGLESDNQFLLDALRRVL